VSWDIRELTAPTYEPVTLDEAKLWCRIEDDDDSQDAMLLLLIYAARERAEAITARAFARRTFELSMDAFPEGSEPIEIQKSPIVSVESVTYATADGDVAIGGSPSEFLVEVRGDKLPGRLMPLYGSSWPTATPEAGSVRIRFTAGYAPGKIPRRVRLWMQQRISSWYEFREHIVAGSANALPRDFVDGLLDDLRARTFFA
jgi:uncharacterized phiE125 gp8 family phage protein